MLTFKAKTNLNVVEAIQLRELLTARTPPAWAGEVYKHQLATVGTHGQYQLTTDYGGVLIGDDDYIVRLENGYVTAIHMAAFKAMFESDESEESASDEQA